MPFFSGISSLAGASSLPTLETLCSFSGMGPTWYAKQIFLGIFLTVCSTIKHFPQLVKHEQKLCIPSQLAVDPEPIALPAAVRREVYRPGAVPETFLHQRKTIKPMTVSQTFKNVPHSSPQMSAHLGNSRFRTRVSVRPRKLPTFASILCA